MRGVGLIAFLLLCLVATRVAAESVTVSGVLGNVHEDFDTPEWTRDMCNACKYLFDHLDKLLEKPVGPAYTAGYSRNKKKAKELSDNFATSESRALEMLENDICKGVFGSTKKKCERFVEENEEMMIRYIREGGNKDPARRESICERVCTNLPPEDVKTDTSDL